MKGELLQKLLVPLDGSEWGERAIPYAVELSRVFGSDIHLVCVPPRHDWETLRACESYLCKNVEVIQQSLGGKNITGRILMITLDGDPATAVSDYSDNQEIGLIVLCSHGVSGIKPWAVGSTANKIIHVSQIPLLMVRASFIQPQKGLFLKILVPLDGSEAGEVVLPYAKAFATGFGGVVVFLRVVDPQLEAHSIGGPDRITYPELVMEMITKEAEVYLEQLKSQLPLGIAQSLVKVGNVSEEILNISKEEKVSLLVMATHNHSTIDRWMLGSVSNKVLNVGEVPLLLIPPKLRKK